MENEIMQELITRYIDGDVTREEKLQVEEALRQSEPLKKFYQEMVNLNSVLKKVPFEETSPDWEHKIKASLRGKSPLGETKMNKMTLAFQALPKKQFAVFCVVLLMSLLTTQVYVKRGIQGRLKQAADNIGDQFSVGNTRVLKASQYLAKNTADSGTKLQYEPYYLDPSYEVVKQAQDNKAVRSISTSHSNLASLKNNHSVSNTNVYKASSLGVDILPVDRMLIQKAQYNLLVEDCDKTFQHISDIIRGLDGVVIESRIEDNGSGKSGLAIFKVFPTKFDSALQSLSALGTVESKNISGDDVTEDYVDLEARLKNQQNIRIRLQAILDQRVARMDEILRVEQEIARVSETIERIEGKLKYYDREVSMSTITIRYHEKEKKAEPVTWSLDFMNHLKDTLKQSAEVSAQIFLGGIMIVAMIVPFLIWIIVAAFAVYGLQKLVIRKKNNV
jgi:hypothetical protein